MRGGDTSGVDVWTSPGRLSFRCIDRRRLRGRPRGSRSRPAGTGAQRPRRQPGARGLSGQRTAPSRSGRHRVAARAGRRRVGVGALRARDRQPRLAGVVGPGHRGAEPDLRPRRDCPGRGARRGRRRAPRARLPRPPHRSAGARRRALRLRAGLQRGAPWPARGRLPPDRGRDAGPRRTGQLPLQERPAVRHRLRGAAVRDPAARRPRHAHRRRRRRGPALPRAAGW